MSAKEKRCSLLKESEEGMREHLVRAVADKDLLRVQPMSLCNRFAFNAIDVGSG